MASVFTSLEAHNSCRVLFNRVRGWAYVGPAGQINPEEFPGTVSYTLRRSTEEDNGADAVTSRGAEKSEAVPNVGQGTSVRPRGNLGRKTNQVLGAFLESAHVEYLAENAGARAAVALEDKDQYAADCPRKGLPIVLTLQAILSRKSCSDGQRSEAGVQDKASPLHDGQEADERPISSESTFDSLRVSDSVQFPPLRSPELFLGPPMVIQSAPAVAMGGVSSGEVVGTSPVFATAETALNVASSMGEVGDGDKGTVHGSKKSTSRVGWWLRWAVSGTSAGAPGDDAADGDNGVPQDHEVSYDVKNGVDGWQLLSVDEAPTGDIHEALASPGGADEDDDMEALTEEYASSWCDCDASSDMDVADLVGHTRTHAFRVPPVALQQGQGVAPRSYLEALLTPNASGETEFKGSAAGFTRQAQRRRTALKYPPRLMPEIGTYPQRRTAARKSSLPQTVWEDKDEYEIDDQYYERKRFGAFAFATKPRGKSHK